ncbi:MAG: hypothetical protein ACE14S_10595 [Candidatus Bathyarchaeia archaeon]
MTVPGVLNSDYYVLYPYETNTSLSVGFSKFGELINGEANVGLDFGAVDPFAPPAGATIGSVLESRWLQGWFINITYDHRIMGRRNVWAMALYSDGVQYGNDWIRVDFPSDYIPPPSTLLWEDPRDPGSLLYGPGPYNPNPTVHGGRKTNGTAVTSPINVLYNGPREFIAECRTTLYDHPAFQDNSTTATEGDIALVQVVITIVFDKVKKEVNLLKDVKSILPLKEGEKMKVEFSNRGEVDLGIEPNYASYAHFYTEGTTADDIVGADTVVEGQPTEYGFGYRDGAGNLVDSWELIQTEDPRDQTEAGEWPFFSAAGPYPQAYPDDPTMDVAQAIHTGTTGNYVWYAGFWPSLSDWSIDGWDNWWHSLKAYDPHWIDLRPTIGEPSIPFYIGEWDFVLYYNGDVENRTQFRGVTEYGVVYQHDAEDKQQGELFDNVIDREVRYYLDQTFNPWDLQEAVHKEYKRWLEWKTTSATTFTTKWFPVDVAPASEWDQYAEFSDRVINMATGKLLNRYKGDYTLTLNADGTATFRGLPTAVCKILYSTEAEYESVEDIGPFDFEVVNAPADSVGDTVSLVGSEYDEWTDPMGVNFLVGVDDLNMVATLLDAEGDFAAEFERELNGWETDFEVFKGSTYTGSWDYQDLAPLSDENVSVAIPMIDIHWYITAPAYQDLHIWELGFTGSVDIVVSYNATENTMNVTAEIDLDSPYPYVSFEVVYSESAPGRYEWVEVGRDAATVDSAGAALVAEAFDSYKEIQIGIAGEDMWDTEIANQIPNVMAKFGSGSTVADYKDAPSSPWNQPGFRAALADDWCTTWPVASSNMICVGGPLANVLAYYSNDFTTAFYGISQFAAGSAYDGKITGIPCWNRAWAVNNHEYNVYSSSSAVGYAVISTYIDINGTEVFDVYGHWGRDTYYACQWLHGDLARDLNKDGVLDVPPGIIQLQSGPSGMTSIILKINYADPKHPTFSIVECLGTISETLWIHIAEQKGGIHDP